MTEEQIRIFAQFIAESGDEEVIIEDNYIFIPSVEIIIHRDTNTIEVI